MVKIEHCLQIQTMAEMSRIDAVSEKPIPQSEIDINEEK
jgi:hypothetical protein